MSIGAGAGQIDRQFSIKEMSKSTRSRDVIMSATNEKEMEMSLPMPGSNQKQKQEKLGIDFEKPTVRPDVGQFKGFDHVAFWVGNAKQSASYFCTRLGFEYEAYRGLETGSRDTATHVVSNGNVRFAFTSPLNPSGHPEFDKHYSKHGDGVKDVAFLVDDAKGIYEKAVSRGAIGVTAPIELKDIVDGVENVVTVSAVKTYGDTTHTFVQRHSDSS